MNYEQGLAAMETLVAWAGANAEDLWRNEAQTRFDLIDRTIESLGWTHPQIRLEVHESGEFSDYELGTPARRLLVEAKREGAYFELPAGWNERVAKLSTVTSGSRAIADAVDQAMSYALKRGIPYAAVANGRQLVAFLASRTDGIAPMDGDALIFASLEEMRSDFRTLWDNLSAPGAHEETLHRTLTRPRRPPTSPRLASRIPGYPGAARRREEQQTLQILGSVFVEDLAQLEESERRFLISCYAPSGALSQYALVSKEILRTRYSLLFDDSVDYTTTPASSHTGLDPNLVGDIAAASLKQRPILLLGDVGVGKSTFIKNLILVAARDQLQKAIVFYLDFGKKPTLMRDLADHVGGEIARQLREGYDLDIASDAFVRGVYHGRLEQFRSSIYGPLRESDPEEYDRQELRLLQSLVDDVDEHIKASLDHISKAHRKQVVVFLDNVDQRDSSFQNELFVIAQTMAESWPVTVFLALRPETFYESRRTGALSAYQPRAFTIAPPRVEIVLKKRLDYALELLKEGGLRTRAGVEISIDLTTLVKFMEAVRWSLEVNTDLLEFLENVSNGNIREALAFLEMYIGSAHVNLTRMMEALESDRGRFRVPLQDVVRSVILGDSEYYDPTRSPIGNVFDIGAPARVEHFLSSILVEFVQARGSASGSDGYVQLPDIFEHGQAMGYPIDSISSSLDRCLRSRFLSTAGFDRLNRQQPRAYRVTSCGLYATRKLVRTFTYIDCMIDDTPIVDPTFFGTLHAISHDRELEARLRRVERFLAYLDESWDMLGDRVHQTSADWPSVRSGVTEDIRAIRERVERRLTQRDRR